MAPKHLAPFSAFPLSLLFVVLLSGCRFLGDLRSGVNSVERAVNGLDTTLTNSLTTGLTDGLAGGVEKAKLDSLLRAATDSMLTELRLHLDTVLVEVPGAAYHFSDSLLNEIAGPAIEKWLLQVRGGLDSLKSSITDDQLSNYVKKKLMPAFRNFLPNLTHGVHDPKVEKDLLALRAKLQPELDTLLLQGMASIGAGIDSSLMSRIDTVLAKIERTGKKTTTSISGMVWKVAIGIAALGLLFFLIRAHLLKLRYRQMVELITKEIDGIRSRTEYDRLVGEISKKMKDKGLEKLLREAVLKKQDLLDQPEWENKDGLLLKLLIADKKGQSTKPLDELLRDQGLEEYFQEK